MGNENLQQEENCHLVDEDSSWDPCGIGAGPHLERANKTATEHPTDRRDHIVDAMVWACAKTRGEQRGPQKFDLDTARGQTSKTPNEHTEQQIREHTRKVGSLWVWS